MADTAPPASARPLLDALGIVASDVGASVRFYRRLGLDFPAEWEGDHVEATTPGGVRVMLDSQAMVEQLAPGSACHPDGRVGLAFRCASAAALDALYAELAADGHGRTEPYDAPWGQRYAQVADPDGQSSDLYAPLDA